jgi:hypothetical protein
MQPWLRSFGRPASWAFLLAALTLLAVGSLAGSAAAQDPGASSDSRDQVVLSGRLDVSSGEAIDTAVIFNGPATVAGTVSETLVVFNGRTEISGVVREDVIVFNGDVIVRSGAEIGGDLVSQREPEVEEGATIRGSQQRVSAEFDAEDFGFASRIAWWIGYSISTLVLGLLILAFAPGLDGVLVETARRRTGASIGIGAAVFFLVPIIAFVLVVIIVTLPLGLFLLLALGLLYTMGYVAGAHVIGRRFVKPPASRFLAFLTGWVILRVLALIPFLGGLLWLAVAVFGLGVLAVTARRRPALSETVVAIPPTPPQTTSS